MEAVLNVKQVHDDLHAQAVVADVERGVIDSIQPRPWQSETCIGDWHYDRQAVPKSCVHEARRGHPLAR